jgi:hypothetical protein
MWQQPPTHGKVWALKAKAHTTMQARVPEQRHLSLHRGDKACRSINTDGNPMRDESMLMLSGVLQIHAWWGLPLAALGP